ncbi:hydantoinase/oxoprolinase family protein [Rhodobacterales bacterium LSUCC0246]|nr:hydantoinase/oxoprolinase family protein [Rhodobacterales bacterium LSUCC0374]
MTEIIIGVDVGGTFTDIFALNEKTGTAEVTKVPTSRPDQSDGFLSGIRSLVNNFSDLSVVVHGTTAGTNALLERKGAKIGVITTQGMRDVLEMRRRDRPKTWGLRGNFIPIAERNCRLEVSERTLADGTIRTPVDLPSVRKAAQELLDLGCSAISILFANSYANSENEDRAVAAVREIWPNSHVASSSEILPEIREFERFSTTALNAYLQPEVSGYLNRLEKALNTGGFSGEFLIVQSNGGVMGVDTAAKLPIRTALSGPAAGVIAAGYIAEAAGLPDIITGDMGGTSFDVSLIANNQSMLSSQTSIDFGMVVRSPMIEITTIGAGGGSIAWVDKGGLLNIGPESAGSTPGPVAYGQGNTRPTVTDANVVLGRIDPENPIGGKIQKLDVLAASKAIETHVGNPLGLSAIEAAEAILRVANSRMAGALRLVSIERGFDPKRFAFMPFGGGGALHACAMLDEVGLAKAIVPRYPGVTSAMGCVIADMRQDFVQTINSGVNDTDPTVIFEYLQNHVREGHRALDAAGTNFESRVTSFTFDMAYQGQTHTVNVPIDINVSNEVVAVPSLDQISNAFDLEYKKTFGRLLENGVRRIINIRTSVTGKRPRFDLATLAPKGGVIKQAFKGTRSVHFGDQWYDTNIYDRLALPVGAIIPGPAILEQPDTTVLIEPELVGRIDDYGNTLIERSKL